MQSFKTRRVGFTTDVKIRTAMDGGGSTQKRCFKASTQKCKMKTLKLVV
ncbi:hypothetical protein HMPREF9554_00994 [Treponema phagedenis F0421]|nr:hypothetical protein HMPREF9554_00994 [Treponema phagedenis F0421]